MLNAIVDGEAITARQEGWYALYNRFWGFKSYDELC
jgi:hypothetical protein